MLKFHNTSTYIDMAFQSIYVKLKVFPQQDSQDSLVSAH